MRQPFAPFPVQTPASAQHVADAARHLARAVVTAHDEDRLANARLLVPVLDRLEAAIEAANRRVGEFSRRITGQGEED